MKQINKIISATVIATSFIGLSLYWANAYDDASWKSVNENSTTNMSEQYSQWKMMWKMKMWEDFERKNNMNTPWGDMLTSFINFETLNDTQKETVKSILDTHRKSMEEIKKAYTGSITDTQKEEIKTKMVILHNDLIIQLSEYVSADNLDAFKKAVENMGSNVDMFLNKEHKMDMPEKFEKMNNMSASGMVKNVDRKQEFQNKWKVVSEANKYLTGKTYISLKAKLVAMDITKLKDIQTKIDILVEKLSTDTKTNEKKIGIFKELRALIDTVLLEKEDNSDSILNELLQ